MIHLITNDNQRIKEFVYLRDILRSKNSSWEGIPEWTIKMSGSNEIKFTPSFVLVKTKDGEIRGKVWEYLLLTETNELIILPKIQFIKIR